jgi:hypothetical protein
MQHRERRIQVHQIGIAFSSALLHCKAGHGHSTLTRLRACLRFTLPGLRTSPPDIGRPTSLRCVLLRYQCHYWSHNTPELQAKALPEHRDITEPDFDGPNKDVTLASKALLLKSVTSITGSALIVSYTAQCEPTAIFEACQR